MATSMSKKSPTIPKVVFLTKVKVFDNCPKSWAIWANKICHHMVYKSRPNGVKSIHLVALAPSKKISRVDFCFSMKESVLSD